MTSWLVLSLVQVQHAFSTPLAEPGSAAVDGKGLPAQNSFGNIPHEAKQHTPLYERSSPINPGHTGSAGSGSPNHADPAFFNTSSTSSSSENEESIGNTAK